MNKRDDFKILWRDIILMGGGTVLAQMINILVQPILTRIISPDDLGVYTFIISLATIIIPIASLKLDMLIVSAKDDEYAQYITDLSIIINLLVAIVYFFVIFIGYNATDTNLFNKYGYIIYLVPLLVLTNGLRFLFISYNNRYKKYKLITGIAILRETGRAVIQVFSGLVSGGVLGLVLGYALSPLIGLRLQMKNYISKFKNRKALNLEITKKILNNEGKRQILYLVPAQFLNSFSASLITISITALFEARALGYYSMGVRILDIPILFISSNVSKVCYQKISENVNNNLPVSNIIRQLILVLFVVSFSGFVLLYLIAPIFTEIIFGEGYSIAGTYIRCLCIMYAIRLVATSFAGVYTIFNKQRFELILNIMLIVSAGIAFLLTKIFSGNIIFYLKNISIGYTIIYCLMLLGYIILCNNYDKTLEIDKNKM